MELSLCRPRLERLDSRQVLELLCAAAKENGVGRLVHNIAAGNPSVRPFLGAGVQERLRNEEYILVEQTK